MTAKATRKTPHTMNRDDNKYPQDLQLIADLREKILDLEERNYNLYRCLQEIYHRLDNLK